MAYDAATGNLVLFGGQNSSGFIGDTWVWNGATWIQQTPPASPPVREAASMAYDTATGNLVLFGGANSITGFLADTWVWNGVTWTQQLLPGSPSARDFAPMVYDTATASLVLFGGNNSWLRCCHRHLDLSGRARLPRQRRPVGTAAAQTAVSSFVIGRQGHCPRSLKQRAHPGRRWPGLHAGHEAPHAPARSLPARTAR